MQEEKIPILLQLRKICCTIVFGTPIYSEGDRLLE